MADPLWFSIAQTIGIGGSLIFYGISCQQQANAQKEQAEAQRQQAKAQDTQNFIAFTDRHHLVWSEAYQKPELERVFHAKVDLQATPPSVAEEQFLNVIFVHYETGWQVAKNSYERYLKPLARDAANFLSLPLPSAVWEKTKSARDPQFVEFVDDAIQSKSK